MIKFFRKIRLQLLTENPPARGGRVGEFSKPASRSGRYLLYAIGEIILVVLGILIALSINNQNETRKTNKLELNMLEQVKNGLISDLKEINQITVLHAGYIHSQQISIEWLRSKQPFVDSLALHINRTFFSESFIFKEAPYETLKKIGLEIIKNDTLRDQISNLYDLKYEKVNLFRTDFFTFKHHYTFLLGENRFKMLDDAAPFKGFQPLDVSKLKSDESFIFNLAVMAGGLQIYNMHLQGLELDIKQLIDAIDLELQSR